MNKSAVLVNQRVVAVNHAIGLCTTQWGLRTSYVMIYHSFAAPALA